MIENYEQYIGNKFMAADGGNYGIYIVGAIPEVDDFVVMTVLKGKVQYNESPRRLDMFKATYRYKLDKLEAPIYEETETEKT